MTTMTTTPRSTRRHRALPVLVAALAVGLLAASCGGKNAVEGADEFGVADCNPSDCVVVDVAASPEKIDLLTELAKTFNGSQAKAGDKRVVVQVKSKASGGAMQLLTDGWTDEEAEGPKPVIWSPAASSWGAILDQNRSTKGQPAMANQGTPFMNTPLVIAMPRPMAEAIGWPDEELGWSDILTLTQNPAGWSAYDHPEWGPFRLGKTNPNFSTSGLHALIAQNYAAVDKTDGLSNEDLARADVIAYGKSIESAVVHYGDTTLTFMNNWYRADQRGNPYSYASAVAVEEKSVIDYNSGNPDGVLQQGEEPRPPRVPLVAIYPKEGTLFSDNPFFILDADWVSQDEKDGAKLFQDFVQQPENQQKVLEFNFRPGNPTVPIAAPIVAANGVDPSQPQTTMQVPEPPVMVALLEQWNLNRKGARVLLVVDISGSMGDEAVSGKSKLDLAKEAAISSLDEFKPEDQVGLTVFSTNLGTSSEDISIDVLPIAPMGGQRERMQTEIEALLPTNGTPLYDIAKQSMEQMIASYDPTLINAVVLLTDGRNEDGQNTDDQRQLADLLKYLQEQTQGENAKPVRLFTIAYGADADTTVLKSMSEASSGAAYNASDPKTINKVFTQVVSNF
jgi:Ca-activated chloride channel family protein